MFPACQKGSLNGKLLAKLGLNKERMLDQEDCAPDALFFYQLLFCIHDKTKHTVQGNPRKPFYPHVVECTEVHAVTDLMTRGSDVGHRFKDTLPAELLHWDGMLVFDGALGGSKGAMLRRFDRRRVDNLCFNKHMCDCMSSTSWLETKQAIKLNNNLLAFRRGKEG